MKFEFAGLTYVVTALLGPDIISGVGFRTASPSDGFGPVEVDTTCTGHSAALVG